MVVEAETKRHTVDVEVVHTVEAPCSRVHSPMKDFYSPSWTCKHWDFSPLGIDSVAFPLGAPLDHNSSQNALIQQEQGNTNNPAATL